MGTTLATEVLDDADDDPAPGTAQQQQRGARDVQAGETVYVARSSSCWCRHHERPEPSLRIRRATVRGAFADLERTKIQEPVQEILDELRGDR
jgi:hypothetical protein